MVLEDIIFHPKYGTSLGHIGGLATIVVRNEETLEAAFQEIRALRDEVRSLKNLVTYHDELLRELGK